MLAVVAVCALMACVPAWAQHFYFAQMTDTHIGDADNAARTEKVVGDINSLPLKVECCVVTGDIFNECILDPKAVDTALGTFKQLTVPVHYVAGNNDVMEGDKTPSTRAAYEKSFGPLATKAEHDGVVFLMLFTEPLRGQVSTPDFDPLKWLAAALKDAGKKPVIIFTHAPDDEDFFVNKMHPGWPKESREKWEALIKSHANIKAVITGHFHRDELHWIGGVPEYVSAPVAGYFGRQTTYRVYEYDEGRVGYRTIYVNQEL